MHTYLVPIKGFIIRHRRTLVWLLIAAIALGWLFGVYRLFFYQKSLQFSYGQPVCFSDPTLLPGFFAPRRSSEITEPAPSEAYAVRATNPITVAGYPIWSRTTCLDMKRPATVGSTQTTKLGLFGSSFIAKRYTIATPARPALRSVAIFDKPVSIQGNLELQLDGPDIIHRYIIRAAHKSHECARAIASNTPVKVAEPAEFPYPCWYKPTWLST